MTSIKAMQFKKGQRSSVSESRNAGNKNAKMSLPLPSSVYDMKSTIYYDIAGKWMHVPRVMFSENKNIRNVCAI